MHTDAIYCGDSQHVLGNTLEFPDGSVDLVYVDPPFFSSRKYEVLWGDGYENLTVSAGEEGIDREILEELIRSLRPRVVPPVSGP